MSMTTRARIAGLSAATMLAVVSLTACSSSDTTETTPSTPAATADASATASTEPSADASTGTEIVGPVVVDATATTVDAEVGRSLDFLTDDPTLWTIESSDAAIVEVTNGGVDGDAVMNPGGVAKAEGTATVTLTKTDGSETRTVTVNVIAAPTTGGEEVAVTEDAATSDMAEGETMTEETVVEESAPATE